MNAFIVIKIVNNLLAASNGSTAVHTKIIEKLVALDVFFKNVKYVFALRKQQHPVFSFFPHMQKLFGNSNLSRVYAITIIVAGFLRRH